MKRLHHFFAIVIGTILFTCWSWQLPSLFNLSAKSIVPPVELAQDFSTPINESETSAPPEQLDNLAMYLQGDQLYRKGNKVGAEEIYRQVKPEFKEIEITQIPEPIYEAEMLEAETLELWNKAKPFVENKKENEAIPLLKKVVESEPGFIPGQIALAQMLEEDGDEDEAIELLEELVALYPDSAEVVMAFVMMLVDEKKRLEASIAARQFSILYLDHPQAGEFKEIAEEQLKKFEKSRRRNSIIGGIGNIVLGTVMGDAPWSSLDSAVESVKIVQLMLADEAEFGAKIAEGYKQKLSLVEDPEIMDYVTQLGLEVSKLMGRDFEYEFNIVRDSKINAFALPGGKVFVNTGAILAARSQAELAGLLGHEVAHSVLSHGMQSVFRNNFLSQFKGKVPLGDFALGLISLNYSRNQERSADILGTRVLATAGYAADGLRNLMETMGENSEESEEIQIEYFSSHPASESRVRYLEELIQRNGYNRYALEGVDKHLEIQQKLKG